MQRATVVVVTYNSRSDLERCFGSLERALAGRNEYRVVAVDNASVDGTLELLAARFPSIERIATGANLGFAAGANLGIRRALDHGSDYVFLLNPDTEVAPDFLDRALEIAASDPSIAAVQSLLLLDPERHLVDSAGNAIHFLGFGYCIDHRRPSAVVDAAAREIPFASGAAALLRTSALAESGLLDEHLFLYCEDLDLGWRLRLAGFRCVLAPASVVFHHHDVECDSSKHFFLERNRLLVSCKNLGALALAVLAPLHLIDEIALFFVAWRQGWLRAKLGAWRSLASRESLSHVLRSRRQVQRTRRVSDRELARFFSSRMEAMGARESLALRVANPLFAAVWPIVRFLFGREPRSKSTGADALA